jgi:adenosylcobinamide-phosphate synthase
VVDLVAGDPPGRWHPVAWIGAALGRGRALLCAGSPRRLLLAGAVVTVAVTAVAAAAGVGLAIAAATLGWPGVVVEALALKSTLSLRGLARAALAVRADLVRSDLAAARAAAGRDLVSRPTTGLDAGHVASATVESVAENLTDAFLAPALFFLAFGLPGAIAYRVINTADAMIGYRDGALLYFGRVAARLDDLANVVPARLAALALVAAAAIAGADGRRALATMRRDHGRTASPNAGWTMSAMAGALGVTLTKPGAYRLGDGRVVTPDDIGRAVRLLGVAAALTLPPLVALALATR